MEKKVGSYLELYYILKSEIILKKMKVNSKFPSIRQISGKYGCNSNTVLRVYKLLEENGYIYSIKGKGSFVKANYDISIDEKVFPLIENFRYGQNVKKYSINFSNGTPSKNLFPVDSYRKYIERAFNEKGSYLLGYQDVQGLESLREAIAEYIEKYDIFVNSDDIFITSGTQQSLAVIMKAFGYSPKKTVVISDPSYPNALNFLEDMCNVRTMDLQKDGWDMSEFKELLQKEKIDFVYETFNFQNPTGVIWSEKKKKELLELAKEYHFYIIEDDCFVDFSYKDRVSSLKSMDRVGEERVIYLKTSSKVLMPGINSAFVIPPKKFMDKFIIAKYGLDPNTSGLNQKVLEYFIKEKELDRHIREIKGILKEQLKVMLEELKKIPDIEVMNIPKGGFFLWVKLPEHIDGEYFYYKCKMNGVSILPGTIFYNNKKECNKIRLSFLTNNKEEIVKGVEIMKKIIIDKME